MQVRRSQIHIQSISCSPSARLQQYHACHRVLLLTLHTVVVTQYPFPLPMSILSYDCLNSPVTGLQTGETVACANMLATASVALKVKTEPVNVHRRGWGRIPMESPAVQGCCSGGGRGQPQQKLLAGCCWRWRRTWRGGGIKQQQATSAATCRSGGRKGQPRQIGKLLWKGNGRLS